jgi:GWxTD domain-containing protein
LIIIYGEFQGRIALLRRQGMKWMGSIFVLIGWAASSGLLSAADHGTDARGTVESIYEEAVDLARNGAVDEALLKFESVLEIDQKHAPSYVGKGHIFLGRGDLDAAEALFKQALRKQKNHPPAFNGLGLVYRERKNELRRAIDYFRSALRKDKTYVEAQFNLAETYERFGSSETLKNYQKVIKMDPSHPEAFFRIGRIHSGSQDNDKAIAAYRQQLGVREDHHKARLHLAMVLKITDGLKEAVKELELVVGQPGAFQRRAVLELADILQRSLAFDRSQALYEDYISGLEPKEQVHYYDLSIIASGEVGERFKSATLEIKMALADTFWSVLDPAPVTAANERLVEHYRRVATAREHMGTHKDPWDDRGEVYVRYGEPDHVSRSNNIRFETDPRVLQVKERLIARAGEAGAILSDDRDDGGFDSNSKLREEARQQRLSQSDGGGTASRLGRGRASEVRSNARVSQSAMLGWPVYPVDGIWEYWIYTNVGNGIEMTFVQKHYPGPYEYAEIPVGTGKIAQIWQRMNPEIVLQKQKVSTPNAYRPAFATGALDFYFYTAAFRGEGGETILEIYYGIPTRDLSFDAETRVANLVRGVAIYDADNRPVERLGHEMKFTVAGDLGQTSGAFIPELDRIALPPGEYRLDVQVADKISGRTQVYRQDRMVNPFSGSGLMLSDIELAATIEVADKGRFQKGEIDVVPMASRSYRPGEPIFIYYEIYNLVKDEFGSTKYRISYEVRSLARKAVGANILRGLGKLLGMTEEGGIIKIEYEHLGTEPTEQAYLELDMSSTAPGRHTLKVNVTDEHGGAVARAATTFTIRE